MRTINKAGIDLIVSFEGLDLKPYLDSGNTPTIGYGTIMYENTKMVTMQDPPITKDKAIQLLNWEVNEKCKSIDTMVKVQISDNEFSALCAFTYNVGVGALEHSTLLKLLNDGADRIAIADQFLKWDMVDGQHITGLTRRRQAERSLFLQPTVQSDAAALATPSDDIVDDQLKALEAEIIA